MNPLKRLGIKLAWRNAVNKMPALKTWSPLIGGASLIVYAVLEYLGHHDAAETLKGIIATLGLAEGSPVEMKEALLLVGGISSVWSVGRGISRKVRNVIRERRAGKGMVTPFQR